MQIRQETTASVTPSSRCVGKVMTVALILGILAFLYNLWDTTGAQFFGPRLMIEQPEMNFGDSYTGQVLEHSFHLHNNGFHALKIHRVASDCQCAAADLSGQVIKPGEFLEMRVSFSLVGKKGPQTQRLVVTTNDTIHPHSVCTLKANAVSRYRIDPSPIRFSTEGSSNNANHTETTVTISADEAFVIERVATSTDLCRVLIPSRGQSSKRHELLCVCDHQPPLNPTIRSISVRTNLEKEPLVTIPVHWDFSDE